MSRYRQTMAEALGQVREAQMVSDISGISITALKKEAAKFKIKVARVTPGGPMGAEYEVTFSGAEKDLIAYAKEHLGFDDKPGNFMQLKKHLNMSYNDIEEISDKLKLKVLARNIKKLKDKFLKKTIPGTGAMFAQKEEVELDEGKMKTIATMFDQGKSAEEIAKALKLPVGTVKSILGESLEEGIKPYVSMQRDSKTGKMNYVVLDKDEKEAFSSQNYILAKDYLKKNYNKLKEQLDEFTTDQIKLLKKSYGGMRGKTIAPQKANMLSKHLDRLDLLSLRQLVKEKIPFLSTLARNKIYRKTGKFEELGEEVKYPHKMYDPKSGKEVEAKTPEDHEKYAKMGYTHEKQKEEVKDTEKKESENKDNTIASLKDQIAMLKTKLENEKNKAVKPEPNPDTGEVPLTVGVAYKHFKDKKEKEVKEDLEEATKNTDFKVKMKTPSGMKMVRVTVPIKDFVVDMAKIEDAARKKVKGDMVNFDFVGDIKMEADLSKKQIKMVHKVADDLPKKDFKDRYGKEKGDAVRFGTATNMVKKKLGMKEDRRLYVETIAGLKKKAEKSGMPYSILKKVYDRGMAAWKSGHRPGASQQQWAFARVNSFVTKSSGTWGGADKDLAKQVRGSK